MRRATAREGGLGAAVDLLDGQADLADRHTALPLQRKPETVSVFLVAGELPLDPLGRFAARVALRVEAHDLWVGEHLGDEIEIVEAHRAQPESLGFEDESLGVHGCC
jgi:hypothetical protein